MNDPAELENLLRSSKSILLVDWPDQSVPRTLLDAGFAVYSYSPDGYTTVSFVDGENNLKPTSGNGRLIFNKLDNPPGEVDIVNVFRPEEELEEIIVKHVMTLKAKTLWLHPPATSLNARSIAGKNGIMFIEGADIKSVAKRIGEGFTRNKK